jgi:Uma2 family endonuclease
MLRGMQAALRPRYTFAEYLEIERRSRDVKHEYVGGEIFAMAGGSVEHSALATALAGLLFAHLRGSPCRPHGSDLQISIRVAEVATYADVAVVCDPVERDPDSHVHVTNPRIIVEVLSPTSERYDREQKRIYYQQLDSLREYVLIAQDRRRVEVWQRSAGGGWTHTIHDAGARAALPSIDYTLDVDELYDLALAVGLP